jgi:DNA-binding NtrC family response regulator
MKTVAKNQPGLAGLSLVEADWQPPLQIAGVSAAWNKLLLQAEMTALHLQVAAIEGEHGSGKHTLVRFLHSRSQLSRIPLQHQDAREWLDTDGNAAMINGILYLDRVDLLASLGQEFLAGVLRDLQDRPAGNIRELACVLESALLEAENGVTLAANLSLRADAEARLGSLPEVRTEDLSLDGMIHRHVEYVLHLHHGNKLRAAKQLNISRSTLYRILANESIAAR